MGKVVAGGTVSLDGYIAGPNGSGFEHLFAWFAGGDRTIPSSELLGSGVRFLDDLQAAPILLDGPDVLVEGSRVTHLRYQVRRS
jgi:hypothetical protein